MGKDDNINVRLDVDLKRRVEAVAERNGQSVSTVIRLMLEEYVSYAERHGGRVVMPLELKDWIIRERNHDENYC